MLEHFQSICRHLFKPSEGNDTVSIFDPTNPFRSDANEPAKVARRLNAAFLILLAGPKHLFHKKAQSLLHP
jgi:hypothetical protein